MTRVTAILNQKGGVGKTTTAQALTAALKVTKHSVLAIDADAQSNLTYSMGGELEAPGLYEVMKDGSEPLIQTLPFGDLLGANTRLFYADREFISRYGYSSIKDVIMPLLPKYDHVIIDCPPNLGVMTENALEFATDVIIPVQPSVFPTIGLSQLFKTISSVQKKDNPGLSIAGILYTLVDKRTTTHRDYMEQINELAKANGIHVYETVIYNAIALQEAASDKASIYEHAPKSQVSKLYVQFAKEYLLQEFNK